MHLARSFGAAAACAVVLSAGGGGCAKPAPPAARQPPEVTVAAPVVRSVTEFLYYEGNLAALERAEIRARVPGYLESIAFDESTDVEVGQALFQIEAAPYAVAVTQAEATVARARAEVSRAQARRDRVKSAFDAGAANELELIEADAELAVRQSAVDEASAGLAEAELQLSYTDVRSPIAGRIDRNYVDVGNLVGDGERTLLATVIRLDELYVNFEASEAIVLRYLARGEGGDVGSEDADPPLVEVGRLIDDGYPFRGRVDYVDNVVDRNTGTLGVRARVPNPDRVLFPGLFTRIRVPFQQIEGAILVPERAVQTDLGGRYVLTVIEDDLVERVPVTVGDRYDGLVHVTSGLAAEARVIVNGTQRARPGLPVRPTPDSPAAPDSSDAPAATDAEPGAAAPAGG